MGPRYKSPTTKRQLYFSLFVRAIFAGIGLVILRDAASKGNDWNRKCALGLIGLAIALAVIDIVSYRDMRED